MPYVKISLRVQYAGEEGRSKQARTGRGNDEYARKRRRGEIKKTRLNKKAN